MKDTWYYDGFSSEPPDALVEFCERQLSEAKQGRSIEAALRVRNSLSGTYGMVLAYLLLTLARIYLIQQNYTEMLETIHIISEKKLEGIDYFSRETGRLLSKAGFYEAAEAWFRKSLSESSLQEQYKYSEFLLGIHLVSAPERNQSQYHRELAKEGWELLHKSADHFKTVQESYELTHYLEKAPAPLRTDIAQMALEKVSILQVSQLGDLSVSLYCKAFFSELMSDYSQAEIYLRELSQLRNDCLIPFESGIIRLSHIARKREKPTLALRRLREGRRNPLVHESTRLIQEEITLLLDLGKKTQVQQLLKIFYTDQSLLSDTEFVTNILGQLINKGLYEDAVELLSLRSPLHGEPTPGIIESKLMLSSYLFDDSQSQAISLFLQALENLSSLACNTPETIVIDDMAVTWDFPEDFLTTTVSRFRNLFASSEKSFTYTQKLALGTILLNHSPRQARSLLRQAATAKDPCVSSTALLLIGYTQLPIDPEVAYGTLLNITNSQDSEINQGSTESTTQSAVYYLLAQSCECTGRYKSIYKYLLKAEERATPSLKSLIQARIGRHWLRKGEPLRALGLFRQAIISPVKGTGKIIESLRAAGLEMAGDLKTAAHTYTVMKHSTEPSIKLHSILCLAGIAARQGNQEKALSIIDSYSDLPLNQKRLVSMYKGRIYQLSSDNEKAIESFREALWPTFSENATTLKLLASSYMETGRKDLAARCYLLSLIEFDYSSRNSLPGEVATLPGFFLPELSKVQLPRLKEAQFLEQKIKQLAMYFTMDSSVSLPENEYNGVTGIKKAMDLLIDEPSVNIEKCYRLVSDIFSEMGRRKIAREYLKKASQAERDRYSSLVSSRDLQNRMIDNLEKEHLKGGAQVTEISSFFPQVKKKRTVTDYISYSIDDMKKLVDESTEKERSKRLFNLGNALFDQKKFDEAAEKYSQALLCPKCEQDSEIRHNLGITLNELGEHKWAVECFQKAISSGNETLIPSCLYNMGNALLEQGKIKESLDSYERCIEFKESNSDLWLHALINIAHCNERLGQRDKAKQCLLEALGKTRQPGWIMLRLAALEINGGNATRARNWKKKAKEEFLKKKDIFGISKLEEILKGID